VNVATSLFTNYANGVYTLASQTSPGLALTSPYMTDIVGTARGSSGVVSRGAYEFGSATAAVLPPAPTGLSVR
jgi:hypothetical protein